MGADATLDPRFKELLRAVQSLGPVEERLLFESTQSAWAPLADGAPLQALVPIYTRRELVGPPEPGVPLVHARLDFGRGQLLGRPLGSWSREEFARFLELYNVGGAVAWSPEARAFLVQQADVLHPAGSLHGFDLYRGVRRSGSAQGGEALVHADYDRLEVSGIAPAAPGGELVLKYHWIDGLRATPRVPIERAAVPDDPVGFIRVRPQGATRIVLWTRP